MGIKGNIIKKISKSKKKKDSNFKVKDTKSRIELSQ